MLKWTADSFYGVALYPLYIRLVSALYQYVESGAVCRTYEKMVFSDKDSELKQKEENWNQLIKEKGLELISVRFCCRFLSIFN